MSALACPSQLFANAANVGSRPHRGCSASLPKVAEFSARCMASKCSRDIIAKRDFPYLVIITGSHRTAPIISDVLRLNWVVEKTFISCPRSVLSVEFRPMLNIAPMLVRRQLLCPARNVGKGNRHKVPHINADIHRIARPAPIVMNMAKEL